MLIKNLPGELAFGRKNTVIVLHIICTEEYRIYIHLYTKTGKCKVHQLDFNFFSHA